MLPKKTTPIKNEILVDIFAKGLLSKEEMRIIFYIIRWSWGFDGIERRQDWTKKITRKKIADDIEMNKSHLSININKMIEENIIIIKDNCYQFNEHYENWKKLPKRQLYKKVAEKATKSCLKGNQKLPKRQPQQTSKPVPERDSDAPKETSKETSKETTTVQKQKINFDFNKEKWENIKNKDKEGWLEAYPSCDINTELAQMREWLISNPNKKKKNYRRFIINWLSRSQERGGTKKPYQSEEAREQAFREQKIKENKRQKEEERIRQQKIIDEVEIRLRDLDPEKRKELEVKAKGEFKKTAGVIRPEREKAFIDGWIKNWVEVGIRAKFSIEETKSRAPP